MRAEMDGNGMSDCSVCKLSHIKQKLNITELCFLNPLHFTRFLISLIKLPTPHLSKKCWNKKILQLCSEGRIEKIDIIFDI